MKKSVSLTINLHKSEGLCWIDENPYLVVNVDLKLNDKTYAMRIRKHVVTNELLYDFSKEYHLFDATLLNVVERQEVAYKMFFDKFNRVVNEIINLILSANKNCWIEKEINLEYEI